MVFEITEGIALYDTEQSSETLKKLSELGFGLAIDDYGTGCSSLSYVRKLPLTELKIDRSLIVNMSKDSNEHAIISAIIELSRRLQLTTVAEGVENANDLQTLKQLGCEYFQGFYFMHPLSEHAFETMLKELDSESLEIMSQNY